MYESVSISSLWLFIEEIIFVRVSSITIAAINLTDKLSEWGTRASTGDECITL